MKRVSQRRQAARKLFDAAMAERRTGRNSLEIAAGLDAFMEGTRQSR